MTERAGSNFASTLVGDLVAVRPELLVPTSNRSPLPMSHRKTLDTTSESSSDGIITIGVGNRSAPGRAITDLFNTLQTPFRSRSDPVEALSRFTVSDISKAKKRRIGGGGFGDVYRLNHPSMGDVALKQLRLSRSADTAQDQRRVCSLMEFATFPLNLLFREHCAKD